MKHAIIVTLLARQPRRTPRAPRTSSGGSSRTFAFFVAMAAITLLSATGIGHATMEKMSLEDLTRGASHIVIGTVDEVKADPDDEGMIYTFAYLSVKDVLKGRLEDRRVVVRVAGGQIGNLSVRVEDQPRFEVGQRVLVFLRQVESPLSSRRLFEVYGLFQGVWKPLEETISKIKRILGGMPSGEEGGVLSLQVTTNKEHYEEGEEIQIRITAKNGGDKEITLDFPSGLQADYVIDGWYRWSKGRMFTMALTSVTIPAGESHTWEFAHTSEDAKLPPGPHRIIALIVGWLRAETQIIVGDLGKIEGTVVDEDGQLLPDVRIVAHRKWNLADLIPLPVDPGEPTTDMPSMPIRSYSTTTDESGAFAIEYLPVGEAFVVVAFREHYNLAWTEVKITSESAPVGLMLSETELATLEGRVLDQNDEPVPEARIEAIAYTDFGWLDLFLDRPFTAEKEPALSDYVDMVEVLFGSMEPWRSDIRSWPPLPKSFSASTDPDGHFVIENVPVGWSLSVRAYKNGYEPAFAEVETTSEAARIELTMTKLRLGQIRGIVMDKQGGAPISEVQIVAYPKWNSSEGTFEEEASGSREASPSSIPVTDYTEPSWWGPYHSVTDENGEFTLNEVNMDRRFVLWAYKEGYDPAWAEVEPNRDLDPTASDVPYVEIALTETEMGVLTGIVLNDAGEAVPGAEILVVPERYPPIPEVKTAPAQPGGEEALASGERGAEPSPEIGTAIAPPRGPLNEYTATTDVEGRFIVEQVPMGRTIRIYARKHGYEAAYRQVEMAEEVFVQLFLIALEEDYPNRNADTRDGVRYESAMDRFVYNADETAKLRYRVVNLEQETIHFSFPNNQRVEFLVLSPEEAENTDPDAAAYASEPVGNWEWPGRVIWRWSEGQEFEVSAGEITLAQGASLVFEETLDLSTLRSEERGFLLIGFLAGMRRETQIYTKFMIEREVPIEAQVTLTGVVMDEQGQPLPDANVAARPAPVMLKSWGPDLDDERYTAVTDEKGGFVLKGLRRGGTYEVTAFVEGYVPRQEIIYAIREQNAVRLVLREEGSGDRFANVSHFVHDGLQIALATDRHFYARDGVIRMCYRITNTREAPIALHFANGQQVDFVLKQGEKVLWRWSDGMGFTEAETTLELPGGASAAFEAKLALPLLDAVEGNLTLSGYLTPSEGSERTRGSLELTVGEEHAVVDVDAEDAAGGPIQVDSRMGMVVELYAPWGIKGQIEFSEAPRNTPEELAGHRFLRIVDFRPDPVLSAFVERIYVEIEYDEAQLNALGVLNEEAVRIFYWDASSDPPKWRKVEGGVDTERNVAWGDVPIMGTQWALFAAEPLAVEEQSDLTPTAFALAQNVPNPFNPSTTIRFSIPSVHRDAQVTLAIYNTLGQRVRTLVDRAMEAGVHSVVWDGRDDQGEMVSSGVYLYRLTTGAKIQTRKMLLIK